VQAVAYSDYSEEKSKMGNLSINQPLRVLGIAGSLRADSYNRKLLQAAQTVAPEQMEIRIYDLHEIPLFNADVEAKGDPAGVTAFKEAIRWADALLIATPEYQHSIPGVLKNALDWGSRPPGKSPLQGKPVAIMGATTGKFGTARAQAALRQVLVYNQMQAVMQPEVLVAGVDKKFNQAGELTDEESLKFIGQLLESLAELTRRFQPA
jgi:chromate reductase, NAD(P)H dehydrogenase (quinone)